MAEMTLKYSKINESLQVGDHVYYTTTADSGSYTVGDSFGSRHIGIVKSITPPTNPAHTIHNVEMPYKSRGGVITNVQWTAGLTANKLKINKADNPNFENEVLIGDFATVRIGSTTNTGITLTNHDLGTYTDSYDAVFSGNMSGAAGTVLSGIKVGFSPLQSGFKTININDTTGIEVGNSITGGTISNTTVLTVDTNSLVTVSNSDILIVQANEVDLTFTGVDNFNTIVVTLDSTTQVMPASTDYFFFVKDNKANKSGLLGYYAEVTLENTDNNNSTELYSLGSEIFESSK